MRLRPWRFVAVLLAALSTGMSFCHVLELPMRRSWEASLWVATTVTGGLYRMFGPAGVGAWLVAALKLVGLAALLRAVVAETPDGAIP